MTNFSMLNNCCKKKPSGPNLLWVSPSKDPLCYSQSVNNESVQLLDDITEDNFNDSIIADALKKCDRISSEAICTDEVKPDYCDFEEVKETQDVNRTQLITSVLPVLFSWTNLYKDVLKCKDKVAL